jgi:hypothetical protein
MRNELPRGFLDEAKIKDIKRLLYEGQLTQGEIAEQFNVQQPTISRIYRGREWFDVEWPNGTKGGIDEIRRTQLIGDKNRRGPAVRDSRQPLSDVAKEAVERIDKVEDARLDDADNDLRNAIDNPKN